jgi:CDP-glucose 4,6-dehydratase
MNSINTVLSKHEKIFLTGHTGFKGTWLTLLLEEMGHEVVGYSLEAARDSLFYRLGRHGQIQEYQSDIRDRSSLIQAIESSKPTVVIHMAAQPLVIDAYKNPLETFQINSEGTANLLHASFASNSIHTIGAVTTDKVYKNIGTDYAYKESDPLDGGSDPYSASKVAAEAAISGWKKIASESGGPNIVTLRSGNVIGGGDFSENRLFPDIIRSYITGKPVQIRNPIATRPWMHVLDSLTGYLQAINHSIMNNRADTFNFGPKDQSLSVVEALEVALVRWPGMFSFTEQKGLKSSFEANFLNLDPTRAFSELGWEPHWSQVAAIESTIIWWRQVLLGELSALEACCLDIQSLVNK